MIVLLRHHIQNIHGNRNLRCHNCSKGFGTDQGLVQHLKYCSKKEVKFAENAQNQNKTNLIIKRYAIIPSSAGLLQGSETQNAVNSTRIYQDSYNQYQKDPLKI